MAVPLANPEIETYAETHTTPEPPYLQAVAEATRAFSEAHSMMVGRLEGRASQPRIESMLERHLREAVAA